MSSLCLSLIFFSYVWHALSLHMHSEASQLTMTAIASVRSERERERMTKGGWEKIEGKHWTLVSHVHTCMWEWRQQYFPQSGFVSVRMLQKTRSHFITQIKCKYIPAPWHNVSCTQYLDKSFEWNGQDFDFDHSTVWQPCSAFKGNVWHFGKCPDMLSCWEIAG